jgi:hypothetical protein
MDVVGSTFIPHWGKTGFMEREYPIEYLVV